MRMLDHKCFTHTPASQPSEATAAPAALALRPLLIARVHTCAVARIAGEGSLLTRTKDSILTWAARLHACACIRTCAQPRGAQLGADSRGDLQACNPRSTETM